MSKEKLLKNMKTAISNVMETMFFQPIQINDNPKLVQNWFSNDQTLFGARLDFDGPVSGTTYILFSTGDMEELTADFLGISREDVHKDQVRDTIKETLNMISGNMLSLCDDASDFHLNIPEFMDEEELVSKRHEVLKGDMLFIETKEKRLIMGLIVT
jgi:CheY-specific phosphatase CheX